MYLPELATRIVEEYIAQSLAPSVLVIHGETTFFWIFSFPILCMMFAIKDKILASMWGPGNNPLQIQGSYCTILSMARHSKHQAPLQRPIHFSQPFIVPALTTDLSLT